MDGWIADLDRLIDRRLDRHDLDRRLARITRRRWWVPRRWAVALLALLADLNRHWARRLVPTLQPAIADELRRLDRTLSDWDRPAARRQATNWRTRAETISSRLDRLEPPPIEQLAYDLRRLDRMRRNDLTMQSQVWLTAILTAYDTRLRLACRSLGITEHLQRLDGVDREIERIRIEGALEAVGMRLRSGHRT
ncbi:hypothetical protein AB0G04_26460 [Actinoplanes sp. NPDC023801]|uniref:hypothetical protein n=1 Tax=Actinoplanes sp. NPDC023801 TaxID=3154595 RepID=UPI0033DC5A76